MPISFSLIIILKYTNHQPSETSLLRAIEINILITTFDY